MRQRSMSRENYSREIKSFLGVFEKAAQLSQQNKENGLFSRPHSSIMNRFEKFDDTSKRKTAEDSASKPTSYNPYFQKDPPLLKFADNFYLNDDQNKKVNDLKVSDFLKPRPITQFFNPSINNTLNQESVKNENKFNASQLSNSKRESQFNQPQSNSSRKINEKNQINKPKLLNVDLFKEDRRLSSMKEETQNPILFRQLNNRTPKMMEQNSNSTAIQEVVLFKNDQKSQQSELKLSSMINQTQKALLQKTKIQFCINDSAKQPELQEKALLHANTVQKVNPCEKINLQISSFSSSATNKQCTRLIINLKESQENQNEDVSDFNIYAKMKKDEPQQIQQKNERNDRNDRNQKESSIPKSYLNNSYQRTQSERCLQLFNDSSEKPRNARFQSQNSEKGLDKPGELLYYISSIVKHQQNTNITKETEKAKIHFNQFFQGIQAGNSYSSQAAKLTSYRDKIVVLPPQKIKRKTIIFDLDETLIHCNELDTTPGDMLFPVYFENGEQMKASINIRPYCQHILQTLSKFFELIIFTASHSSYANTIIDYLDPERKFISQRFYREHCIRSPEGQFIKDLRIIGNRSLCDILIVDNEPYSFLYQVQNGVPIIPYIDNKQDEELRYLSQYLMQFRDVEDVRDMNSALMKYQEYSNYKEPVELLKTQFKECWNE